MAAYAEEEWLDWAHNYRRGATFIPRDPVTAYAEHGWVSWVGIRLILALHP